MKIKGVGKHNELRHTARYIKSIVYGGLDGMITTFAIVAGVAGAALSANIVLILGFANLIADGISMAAGDYLSTKSEIETRKTGLLKRKQKITESPFRNGCVTFLSFVLFGFIPLLVYVLDFFVEIKSVFKISIILTIIGLFLLGSIKTKVTGEGWIKSGFETLLIGGIAASAAYFIGYFISTLI